MNSYLVIVLLLSGAAAGARFLDNETESRLACVLGASLVAMYIGIYSVTHLIGMKTTYTLLSVLTMRRIPPGSWYVLLGYILLASFLGVKARVLAKRLFH